MPGETLLSILRHAGRNGVLDGGTPGPYAAAWFVFILAAALAVMPPAHADQVTLTMTPYWNLLAIPTNVVGGTSPQNLFPGVRPYPDTVIYKDRALHSFDSVTYIDADLGEWTAPNPLSAGEAVWFYTTSTQTLTWNVSGPAVVPPVRSYGQDHHYHAGAINFGTAAYEDIAGGPPVNETALLRHVNKSTPNPKGPPAFKAYYFTDGAWTPSAPVMDPGEGVLIIHPYLSLKLIPTNSPPGYVATWPRNGSLEQANTPNGPWTTITNAVSPYQVITESGLEGSKFYRVVESWDPLDF
jgi:hypothetical protein